MEGLIKGLAKAAIDALDGGGDHEAPRRQRPAAEDAEEQEGREDRDRSTWAEVRPRRLFAQLRIMPVHVVELMFSLGLGFRRWSPTRRAASRRRSAGVLGPPGR
jgi:hypothetical protein